MITWQALFGYSLLATVVSSLVWFAFRIAWPRKVEIDPLSEPHGDVVNAPRRSL
jgi:hypothetical protein